MPAIGQYLPYHVVALYSAHPGLFERLELEVALQTITSVSELPSSTVQVEERVEERLDMRSVLTRGKACYRRGAHSAMRTGLKGTLNASTGTKCLSHVRLAVFQMAEATSCGTEYAGAHGDGKEYCR